MNIRCVYEHLYCVYLNTSRASSFCKQPLIPAAVGSGFSFNQKSCLPLPVNLFSGPLPRSQELGDRSPRVCGGGGDGTNSRNSGAAGLGDAPSSGLPASFPASGAGGPVLALFTHPGPHRHQGCLSADGSLGTSGFKVCTSPNGGGVQWLSHVRLCHPMDCSPPGSAVHGISQAILDGLPFPSPSPRPRDRTCISCIADDSLPLSHLVTCYQDENLGRGPLYKTDIHRTEVPFHGRRWPGFCPLGALVFTQTVKPRPHV